MDKTLLLSGLFFVAVIVGFGIFLRVDAHKAERKATRKDTSVTRQRTPGAMVGFAIEKVLPLVAVVLVASLFLFLGSRFHVSSHESASTLQKYHVAQMLRDVFKVNLPELPKITLKEKLEAPDAVVNALGLFVSTATFVPVLMLLVLAGIAAGLYRGDWGTFGISALLAVLSPIALLVLFALTWLTLLFQACTPGYVLAWIVLGLPAAALGGGSSTVLIVIIVRR